MIGPHGPCPSGASWRARHALRTERQTLSACRRAGWWAALILLSTTLPLAAQFNVPGSSGAFTDITNDAGLTHVQRRSTGNTSFGANVSGGAAVGDFFGNGLLDLFVTRHDDTDILYRNMGDGTFQDVTTEVFGPEPINARTNGAMFADLDNDGALDLYVTTNGDNRHYLYMNDGNGKLVEQGMERGVAHERDRGHIGMSVTAGDYTGNGSLDLYVSAWELRNPGEPARNRLFRNNGNGYFEDVTVASGVDTAGNRNGFAGRFADMDRNGLMDLVVTNDYGYSQYYQNNGDGTFAELADTYNTGTSGSEMGSTVADYNNDGYLDWFTTAVSDNRLYRNDMHRGIDGVYYTDQSWTGGVRNGDWGWGASFIDYDNDGYRDLVMVNGYDGDTTPMRFWRNKGPGGDFKFERMDSQLGLTDRGQGRGIVVADFFNTGFLDILVINHAAQPVLYRNNGSTDHDWLRINTVGEVSNRMGIGAFITVQPDLDSNLKYVHDINLGSNFLAHNETTAHFGLGDLDGLIDYIHILWPSGIEQEFFNVEPNQLLTINELSGLEALTTTTAVPEPTSLALLSLAVLMLHRRRGVRRNRVTA